MNKWSMNEYDKIRNVFSNMSNSKIINCMKILLYIYPRNTTFVLKLSMLLTDSVF